MNMHLYKSEATGNTYPSVTTILKIIGSDSIIHWANFLGYKRISYDAEMERTANIGINIHTCVRSVVDPTEASFEEVLCPNQDVKDYYLSITERFKSFINKFTYKTIFTEKAFVSDNLKYGGTIDWYADISGLKMLIDFKSSRDLRFKHLLQLGGYYSLLKEVGYDVDGGGIIIINATTARLCPVRESTLVDLSSMFNKLVPIYSDLEGGDKKAEYDKDFLKEIMDRPV